MSRKNFLALIMSMVMVFTSVNIAFASTTNNQLSRTLSNVSSNVILVEDGLITSNTNNAVNGVNLILKPQINTVSSSAIVVADITLQNAEWLFTENISTNNLDSTFNLSKGNLVNNVYTRNEIFNEIPYTLEFSGNRAILTIPANVEIANNKQIVVPLVSRLTSSRNSIVTITPRNNMIQSSSHVFVNNINGRTSTEVNDYTFTRNRTFDHFDITDLTIRELQVSTIQSGVFRITAPSFVDFLDTPRITANNLVLNSSRFIRINEHTWEVEIDINSPSINIAEIQISNLSFRIRNDQEYEDINFRISNVRGQNTNISEERFRVARHDEIDFILRTNQVPTLINGVTNIQRLQKTSLIRFNESNSNFWDRAREITFSLPENIRIRELEIVTSEGFNSNLNGTYREDRRRRNDIEINNNSFTIYNINRNRSEQLQLEFYLTLDINLGHEEDVYLTMNTNNSSLVERSTLIARVRNPIEIKTEITDVFSNKKNKVSDIEITENIAGALTRNNRVEISLHNETNQMFHFSNDLKVEVTNGNLSISNINISNGILSFNIDRQSTRASTIRITNVNVDIGQRIDEFNKNVKLIVGGIGITSINNLSLFGSHLSVDYLNLINEVTKEIIVTPNVPFYQLNGVLHPMEVSPFIQHPDRLMVPLRFIAEALSAEVFWDGGKIATVIHEGKTIHFTFGSNEFIVNGVRHYMDTEAIVLNNRCFIPMKFIGEALDIDVKWTGSSAIYTVVR